MKKLLLSYDLLLIFTSLKRLLLRNIILLRSKYPTRRMKSSVMKANLYSPPIKSYDKKFFLVIFDKIHNDFVILCYE